MCDHCMHRREFAATVDIYKPHQMRPLSEHVEGRIAELRQVGIEPK